MSVKQQVSVRSARPDEAEMLGELCLRSKAVWGYDAGFLAACRDELLVSADAICSGLVQVAEAADRVVGVAEISVDQCDAYLEKLFVDPDRQKTGAGRALFVWAADAVAGLGAKNMIVEADPGAVPFYRKMGCIEAGTAPSGSIPGRDLPRLLYVT